MITKTIRTPSAGLILFQNLCAQCYDYVFKSTLLCQSHTTRHSQWLGSSLQKEKPRKQFIQYYLYHAMKMVFQVFVNIRYLNK